MYFKADIFFRQTGYLHEARMRNQELFSSSFILHPSSLLQQHHLLHLADVAGLQNNKIDTGGKTVGIP